jgi:hypothetical protein
LGIKGSAAIEDASLLVDQVIVDHESGWWWPGDRRSVITFAREERFRFGRTHGCVDKFQLCLREVFHTERSL